jgi:hypothetical protein
LSRRKKILLDLVAGQNALVQSGVKDGLGLTGLPAALTDAFREGVNSFVDMQKKFLDMANSQSQAAVTALKEGKTFEGKNLGEVAREGVENFVHTQKKFLDLVTELTQPETHGKGRKTGKPVKLTELAKEGMDQFVDSQKKLLDLATSQIEGAMKTAEAIARPSPEPSTSLGDFARRGIENFINAQKSLLDVAMKPFMPPPPTHTHTPAHAHAGRKK